MSPATSHKNASKSKKEDSTELRGMNLEYVPHHFCSTWRPDSFEDSHDVVIVVDGERYAAHKCILTAASPIFKVMLSSGMRESVKKEVVLKSVQKKSWDLVFHFMYTSNVEIKEESTCLDILLFAHQYEMELLLRQAEIVMAQYITAENAIERLLLADKLGLQILRKDCIEVVERNFVAIRKTQEFKNLPFRIIDEILLSDTDQCISQLQVFEAINGWAHASSSSDEPIGSLPPWKIAEAEHLLTHLDFAVARQEGINSLANHPGINSYPGLVLNLLRQPPQNMSSNQGHNKRNKRRTYCPGCGYSGY